jgi:hypothetical protein
MSSRLFRKHVPTFYRTSRFSTAFKTARHRSTSRAKTEFHIVPTYYFTTHFNIILQSTPRSSNSFLLRKKVKLFLYFTNEALRHKDVWRSGGIDPCFLDLEPPRRFTPGSYWIGSVFFSVS